MHVKKGDTVKITAGKDKGKTGKIIKSIPKEERVIVDGANIYKKHVRPEKQGESGQVVEVARPIHASNVALVCPSCSEATKTGYRAEGEEKVRYCKKCEQPIIE